jgi:hypothetical protein
MRINFSSADFSNGPNAGAHHDNIMKAILHALPVVLGEKFGADPRTGGNIGCHCFTAINDRRVNPTAGVSVRP